MTKEQKQVQKFHEVFGLTVKNKPTFPNLQDFELHCRLLREELEEFCEAARKEDMVGIADGLADLLYVLLGTAVTYGIDLEPIFQEVHSSNMSKLWTLEEIPNVPDTCKFQAADKISSRRVMDGNIKERAFVVKREDGKIIKSPSYKPANIAKFLK